MEYEELENSAEEILAIYMKDAGHNELLTANEEKELLSLVDKYRKAGDECANDIRVIAQNAREKLIKSNLRLVMKIAKDFRNLGLDYADLISEGNLGLMTAIDKYDIEKGAKLSYYASFWIKQSIRRAISNKGRTIRLPVGVVDTKLKINKFSEDFETKNGRNPDNAEINEGTGIPLKKIKKIKSLELQSESINKSIDGDNGGATERGDLIINEKSISPFLCYADKNEAEVLSALIEKLERRQRYIIIRRFGLDGSEPQTLEAIGQEFDLTRERIRQLELSALKSLKDMYKGINKNKFIE